MRGSTSLLSVLLALFLGGAHAPVAAPTTADNEAATRMFSRQLLTAIPMPPGSQRLRDAPIPYFRERLTQIGPSDLHFSRTAFWTVPMSRKDFAPWIRAHTPAGLSADEGTGGSDGPGGPGSAAETSLAVVAASDQAHGCGWINFSYVDHDNGIAVRVDTFTGARFARTVRVPESATAVTVRRVLEYDMHDHATVTAEHRLTEPGAIARFVRMVNRLPGAMTKPTMPPSCGPFIDERARYDLTFTTPDGTYVAAFPGLATCSPPVTLTHDGVRAGQDLQPDGRLQTAIDGYLPPRE